jgi:hypothetical protein
MNNLLQGLKNALTFLFIVIVIIGPYALLFYKGVNVRIRLLFISLADVFILCILSILPGFISSNLINSDLGYVYEMVVPLNVGIIFISWIISKMRPPDRKRNTNKINKRNLLAYKISPSCLGRDDKKWVV